MAQDANNITEIGRKEEVIEPSKWRHENCHIDAAGGNDSSGGLFKAGWLIPQAYNLIKQTHGDATIPHIVKLKGRAGNGMPGMGQSTVGGEQKRGNTRGM